MKAQREFLILVTLAVVLATPALGQTPAPAAGSGKSTTQGGITYPNPANQCWPEPLPFIYKNFGLILLQRTGS